MNQLTAKRVSDGIKYLTQDLLSKQQEDGHWNFCAESATLTDSYMLLLMKVLKDKDDELEKALIDRILSLQTKNGTWKLFADQQDGDVSLTIESSMALLYSQVLSPQDVRLKRAREFLISRANTMCSQEIIRDINPLVSIWGGFSFNPLTKVVLNFLSHLSWSKYPKVPVEMVLLPLWSPINFFDLVGYARMHTAPVLITLDRSFSIELPGHEQIQTWLAPVDISVSANINAVNRSKLQKLLDSIPKGLPDFHKYALKETEEYMLQRIETDGLFYSYFSTTFLMIFALLALGYSHDHPVIQKAYQGLKKLIYPMSKGVHIQEANPDVWNTSLILNSLQKAGLPADHPAVKQGVNFLLKRQQTCLGDWAVKNPHIIPGGWGFSNINTINPDIDDTQASLSALAPTVRQRKHLNEWKRGVDWLLSMQNRDGGWPAFEKETAKSWIKLLGRDFYQVFTDPSCVDLTGRTLVLLGKELKWTREHPVIKKALTFILRQQRKDGSWFGRWGISFIYGTWAALTGCEAIGVSKDHPAVKRSLKWLINEQNQDGGWGESCYSDQENYYVPLGASTPSQTSWALDALIAYHDNPIDEIERGIQCLLELLPKTDWRTTYPTGSGFARFFYFNYHSYNYIWPLMTLANYHLKYGGEQ